MKRIKIYSMIVLFLLVSGMNHLAAETYKIATFPIPLMVESKTKGVFIDLVKEISNRANVKIEITVKPTNRTVKNFNEARVDGFFPALDVMIQKKVAKTKEIYIKQDFVFVKKGKTPIIKIKNLEGKRIGLTRGYPYVRKITSNKKIKFDYANNDVTNMKKLSIGRFDGFIVEEKSGLAALEKSGKKNIHYNPKKPISKQKVYFAFQNNKIGKMLAKKFSKALIGMKNDGTFKKIMNKAKKVN